MAWLNQPIRRTAKSKNEMYYYMMDPNEIYKRFMIRRLGAIERGSCYIDIFAFILDRKIDYTTNRNSVFVQYKRVVQRGH